MATTKIAQNYGTGRRKTSVARVFIRKATAGKADFTVNGVPMMEYFPIPAMQISITKPLAVSGMEGKFTVLATVEGGGFSGQAGALSHGLARALMDYDEEGTEDGKGAMGLRKKLRADGLVTRDPRRKERKKPGLRGARKRPQYSKR